MLPFMGERGKKKNKYLCKIGLHCRCRKEKKRKRTRDEEEECDLTTPIFGSRRCKKGKKKEWMCRFASAGSERCCREGGAFKRRQWLLRPAKEKREKRIGHTVVRRSVSGKRGIRHQIGALRPQQQKEKKKKKKNGPLS